MNRRHRHLRRPSRGLLAALTAAALAPLAGAVPDVQKISPLAGGMPGPIAWNDTFGQATAALGDLDGDGVGDMAVGAPLDDDGGTDRGAVWILFLNADGTVAAQQKISDLAGGFTGALSDEDRFGRAVTRVDDLDGDGVDELAVGAPGDDDGGIDAGSVWILFMNADGTVKAHQRIGFSDGAVGGGLNILVDDFYAFGSSLTQLGDLDGDGATIEIVAGAPGAEGNGDERGAVYVLAIRADGRNAWYQAISDGFTGGGFGANLTDGDHFGTAVSPVGDISADGIPDLAVGAPQSPGFGTKRGAVWLLRMNADGTVASWSVIRDNTPIWPIDEPLINYDEFGTSLAFVRDMDGDGLDELAVGTIGDDDGAANSGCLWFVSLSEFGAPVGLRKLSADFGGYTLGLGLGDAFGSAVSMLGDLDGDGENDLVVGVPQDDDGGPATGSVLVLFTDLLPFENLGGGLGGGNGVPQQGGQGEPAGGETIVLELLGGPSHGLAYLVLGASELAAPFKGGTLVPAMDIVKPVPTDASGAGSTFVRWPSGQPDGTTLWSQFWMMDAGAPEGWAASNALMVVQG